MPAVVITHDALAMAEAVQHGLDETVLLVEPGGYVHIVASGAPIVARLGHSLEELLASPSASLRDNDDIRLLAAYRAVAREPGKSGVVHFQCRDRSGEFVELQARATNRRHERVGAIVVHVRISSVGESTTDSTSPPDKRMSNMPQLERVEDRESFIVHAQRIIDRKVAKVWSAPAHARAVMRDRRWDYALMLIYLDRFNVLLGGFGADALNAMCMEGCSRVRAVLRGGDAVAPVGATEIAVLLEGVSDERHIQQLTDLALNTLRTGMDAGGARVSLVPIAGIASSTRRYDEASALLQDAAAAAGRALLRGTGPQHETFKTEFRTETIERMNLMVDLKEGIARGELFLLYQTLHALGDGRCTALEAFVRWQHPERGLVMPGDFIPMAEETGLIRPLTEWVLNAGCSAMVKVAKDSNIRLHLNVGAAELSQKSFYRSAKRVLDETGFAPNRLCLDMSESALIDGSETAHETMHRLGAKGVCFALDDYGTGGSSLRYLADLPFDYVKIDTSISQQVDDAQRRIARAMISLAHELGRQVIAEGVESEAQKNSLTALGSDEAQGYFFSRPVALEKLAPFFA